MPRQAPVALALLCSFACRSPSASTPPHAPPVTPTDQDPLTALGRVEGSTFVEVAEAYADASGRLIYCSAVRGLHVVDARNPLKLSVTSTHVPSLGGHGGLGGCQHLAVEGERVFVTNRGNSFLGAPYIVGIDISGDSPTEFLTFRRGDTSFEGLAARGDRIYAAMHDDGLGVFAVEGDSLSEVSVLKEGIGSAWDVVLGERHLYLADATGALLIYELAESGPPRLLSRTPLPGTAQAMTLRGSTVYIAAGSAGVVVVEAADPSAPRITAELDTPGAAVEIAASDTHLFVADWDTARVYDLVKPSTPTIVAVENIETDAPFSRVLGIAAHGKYAFIGEWTGMYAYELHAERTAPALALESTTMAFSAAGREGLLVENHGTAPLRLEGFDVEGPGFAVEEAPSVLPPGGSRVLQVSYVPSGEAKAEGQLLIRSNDPDRGVVPVALKAGGGGVTVGVAAPETILELLDGGTWKLSEQRGKVVLLAYFATF